MRFAGWVLGTALCTAVFPAWAGDVPHGTIIVQQAWARASAGQAPNGAAFLTIVNSGTEADKLVSASSNVAKTTELHTHIKEGDVMPGAMGAPMGTMDHGSMKH